MINGWSLCLFLANLPQNTSLFALKNSLNDIVVTCYLNADIVKPVWTESVNLAVKKKKIRFRWTGEKKATQFYWLKRKFCPVPWDSVLARFTVYFKIKKTNICCTCSLFALSISFRNHIYFKNLRFDIVIIYNCHRKTGSTLIPLHLTWILFCHSPKVIGEIISKNDCFKNDAKPRFGQRLVSKNFQQTCSQHCSNSKCSI